MAGAASATTRPAAPCGAGSSRWCTGGRWTWCSREQAHRRRAEGAAASIEVEPDHADEVATTIDRPGEQEAVRAALAVLPDDQRAVIDLMYFQGVSQTGVAERLGIPLGTVKSRSLLAMRKLRGVMGTER